MRRQQVVMLGKIVLMGAIAAFGIAALSSGRFGGRRLQWIGLVFAPVALLIVALFIAAEVKGRRREKPRQRR